MAAVQQMIGRAGRPQFDTLGRVVIMTQSATRNLYAALADPVASAAAAKAALVESNLKENMIGHLNAEIVLGTITDAVRACICGNKMKLGSRHGGRNLSKFISSRTL